MSAIDDSSRLKHMRDAAIEAISFVDGYSRGDLESDRRSVLAIVKAIEIIGEAANRISKDCQNRHLQIPWADVIGMRNRLVHAYFDIDLDIIWQVVIYDLPPLLKELEKIIALETDL
jgi:uncharacterized protein with HEPN domain